MLRIKTLLLLTVSTFFLYACGGSVESTPDPTDPTNPNDTTAPTFVSGEPEGSVTSSCNITAEFDEPIDEASVTSLSFTITEDVTGTQLSSTDGTWGLSSSSATIAQYAPSITLSTNQYTVKVTTEITDVAGNHLAADQSWFFTSDLPCPP